MSYQFDSAHSKYIDKRFDSLMNGVIDQTGIAFENKFSSFQFVCQMSKSSKNSTCAILCIFIFEICQANVIFHFSLDFNVKHLENSTDTINKTILVNHNNVTILDNEDNSTWPDHNGYNNEALTLLLGTKRAVQELNRELSPLVGRSNELAVLLKKTMRYVNDVDACLENGHFSQRVEHLRKYLSLVETLRSPSSTGGARTLEFALVKLALEKHQLLFKYDEIAEFLLRAQVAWMGYKNTQIVVSNIVQNT